MFTFVQIRMHIPGPDMFIGHRSIYVHTLFIEFTVDGLTLTTLTLTTPRVSDSDSDFDPDSDC